jgi:1-acyl-sn-glycerol-3-phosphate acyltransferase
MRFVLAPLRAALLLVHIVAGLATVLLVFPFVRLPVRNRIIKAWSYLLVRACGARISVKGEPIAAEVARTGIGSGSLGRLVVANHVSWIDVFAINAVLPCRFVAKAEIGRWPLLGALVTRSGTLYIERGRRHAVAAMNHRVRDHLKAGDSIAVFPEGTTTDGSELLPFHSNLLAPVVDAGAPIWPLAVRYLERGAPSTAAAFVGDMDLATSLARILAARGLMIEIVVLAPLNGNDHGNRHALARAARESIAAALGLQEAMATAVTT